MTEGTHTQDHHILSPLPNFACQDERSSFSKYVVFSSHGWGSLCDRTFKYDSSVEEYFVETADSQTLKLSEIHQIHEVENLEALWTTFHIVLHALGW